MVWQGSRKATSWPAFPSSTYLGIGSLAVTHLTQQVIQGDSCIVCLVMFCWVQMTWIVMR